ncbi:hypothetical protein [Thermotoga sp. KOL6]|uniref:hypothetical protein n=1 Tax=Thermotoga sp. KOL6 TaxID=126741 RepID=UPI000C770375|nr:hypothetical protein [Thermotoga sp. KOL6]PLV59848.1 hypothetical protein AS005_00675 [Thermotoga sp. KOL6]
MRKWGLGAIVFFLLCSVSFSITTYKYNKETGRWEQKVKEDVLMFPSIPENMSSNVVTLEDTKRGQWYYYMEYELGSGEELFSFWAGQTTNVGTVIVWNDDEYLYNKLELGGGWLLEEAHLNILSEKPQGNQAPGQFPYKKEFETPTASYTFKIPLSDLFKISLKNTRKVEKVYYILFHGVVSNGSKEETAWAGRCSNSVWIKLSATKVKWLVKKPGVYVSKVLEVEASKDLSIFVSLPNPTGVNEETSVELKIATGEEIPTEWFDELAFTDDVFSLWQRIDISRDLPAGDYKSVGTITFTIKNTKLYVDISPKKGE